MTGKEILRKAPVIKASFAPEKVRYGDVLRIYIEAEASDEVMLRIASVVDQVGYGYYQTDWIYLKPEYQQHFRGFLQWNTSSSSAPYVSEWTQVTLKISVFDKAGNQSNAVVFPFQFVSEAIPVSSPPLPFHEGDPRNRLPRYQSGTTLSAGRMTAVVLFPGLWNRHFFSGPVMMTPQTRCSDILPS